MGKKISSFFKKNAVRTLAFSLKSTLWSAKKLRPFFTGPIGFFWKIFSKTLFHTILPFYRGYLISKRIFNRFYAPIVKKHKLIHPFSRRYLTHVIVIFISLFVVTANLNAHEVKRDDRQYSNVFTTVLSGDPFTEIEEDSTSPQPNKITRYLGTSGVESTPQNTEQVNTPNAGSVSTGAIVRPILSPTEANIRKRDKIISHVVEQGETISEIAQNYGISVNTILWANKLTSYSVIRPGQSVKILPISGIQYKIASGDTIEKIAKKYRVDSEAIIEFNKLASADDINIGEELMIPGGSPPPPPQTYVIRQFTPPAPQPIARSGGKLNWPASCGRITQYFNSWRHKGLDIACSYGSSVEAAADGTVIKAQGGWNGGYGIMVIIDHGGYQTLYGHLSKLYVTVGQQVSKGQSIGSMGSTGQSTGSHVHFEYRTGGYQQNPLDYL